MSLKSYISIEPVRSLSALLAFGAALITGLAYNQGWSGEAVGLISGSWAGFIALVGTFFTREQVTSNPNVLAKVHDTILELAPFTPVITEAVVPVASSPLLDTTVVVNDHDGQPVDGR